VQPGHAADHSPPSSAEVMEKQSYTSTHPLGHTGPVIGLLYLHFLHCFKCCKFVILITLSHIFQDAVQYSCTVYILLVSFAKFLFMQLFIHTHYTSVTMCPLLLLGLRVTWRNRLMKRTVVYSLFHVLWS
jgi:hypothetical protein